MRRLALFVIIGMALAISSCSDDRSLVTPAGSKPAVGTIPAAVQDLINRYAVGDETTLPNEPSAVSSSDYSTPADTFWDVYSVTFIWGSLCNSSSSPGTSPVDWSGTLGINGEAVVNVTKTISFEAGQDSIIPSGSPASAAWVSQTTGDFDGATFIVSIKRGNVYFAPLMLSFDTPPFQLQLPTSKLSYFTAYYQVSNTSGVVVHSHRIFPGNCPSGLMYGEWVRANVGGESGEFHGIWTDESGVPTAVFSCTFWTNNDGTRAFSGNVSGITLPVIIAYLEGTWYYDDPRVCPICGASRGKYMGKFTDANDGKVGHIMGEFGDVSLDPSINTLPLRGIWFYSCPMVALGKCDPLQE